MCKEYLGVQDVCVVTVTYGDRSVYVNELLSTLSEIGVVKVVVVDNGTEGMEKIRLSDVIRKRSSFAQYVRLEKNCGSATGFSKGLQFVVDNKVAPLVWFLDDDNIPKTECLKGK